MIKAQWISNSEDDTCQVAIEVARRYIHSPSVICLYGDLGAGKTAFSRALIRHVMNSPNETVPSPTYTLVQTYNDDQIWHFDLYRLDHESDLYDIGWEEAMTSDLCLIEWPERMGILKPKNSVDIIIESLENAQRRITLKS